MSIILADQQFSLASLFSRGAPNAEQAAILRLLRRRVALPFAVVATLIALCGVHGRHCPVRSSRWAKCSPSWAARSCNTRKAASCARCWSGRARRCAAAKR